MNVLVLQAQRAEMDSMPSMILTLELKIADPGSVPVALLRSGKSTDLSNAERKQ